MRLITCLALTIAALPLAAAPADDAVNLIVQFRGGTLSRQIAQCERAGARLHRSLPLIHGAAFSVPPAAVKRVRQSPEVISVSEEAVVRQSMYDVTPAVGADAALAAGWTGRGIGVAIIDSGISANN